MKVELWWSECEELNGVSIYVKGILYVKFIFYITTIRLNENFTLSSMNNGLFIFDYDYDLEETSEMRRSYGSQTLMCADWRHSSMMKSLSKLCMPISREPRMSSSSCCSWQKKNRTTIRRRWCFSNSHPASVIKPPRFLNCLRLNFPSSFPQRDQSFTVLIHDFRYLLIQDRAVISVIRECDFLSFTRQSAESGVFPSFGPGLDGLESSFMMRLDVPSHEIERAPGFVRS